jgi:hypothetical protein
MDEDDALGEDVNDLEEEDYEDEELLAPKDLL